MEMMYHDGGVKNVVISGRPNYGSMQTPSGSRDARFYDLDKLDTDIEAAVDIYTDQPNNQPNDLPNRSIDFFFYDGEISLRAQVRRGETVPLAMQFEAAYCRIILTPNTFNNFTNLWSYAADAIWTSPQPCTQGSTRYATSGNISSSAVLPAPAASLPAGVNYTSIGVPFLNTSDNNIPFLIYDGPMPDGGIPGQKNVVRRPGTQQTSQFSNPQPAPLNPKPGSKAPQRPASHQQPLPHGKPGRPVCSSSAPLCNRRHKRRSFPKA
ncbi:hypothetical protein EV356DRAFT_534180 [Viridothelium virens]|uniref:Uncharacterized protein n=1 Tax=Viridothelium virens TaxID=1048519 RepID=A0A6A6H4S1_VIRVR|nr:hypothetical protein EV356DRAFT_534180 [Viridothelium virens]